MTQRTSLAALWRSILCAAFASMFACSNSDGDSPNKPATGSSLLLNYTGNYESGELRWMDADSASLAAGAWAFAQDSKVAAGGGSIFVLSRFPGAIACISPEEINNPPTKQTSLGDGDAQNPYGAAAIGGKGYIALNDEDYIQSFDISSCALGDAIPLPISGANAAAIAASGDTLLVLLQRLENWSATKPGLLARINAASKTLIDTIQLKFYNPNSAVLGNGKLYVSSQRYGDDYSIDLEKSGVEAVDLAKGASEVLADGMKLGGGAYAIALSEASQTLYVVVYEDWGSLPVKPLNIAGKAVGAALPNIADASGGLVFDEKAGRLFAGDASGLKIYDEAAKATIPVNEGAGALPPYSLAIVRQ